MLKGLWHQGHSAIFFERDAAYYAQHRDLASPDFCELVLYTNWESVVSRANAALARADVAIVTSYCSDGLAASRLMLDTQGPLHVFYDMDTPVTVAALEADGVAVAAGAHYLTPELIPEFDLYLSFSGGPRLDCLAQQWGTKRVAPLYGAVDPDVHAPVANPPEEWRCAMGYLGTYAADRQVALQQLLIEPAHRRPHDRFLLAGSLFPQEMQWPRNVVRMEHLEPARHPAFYSANRLTLSVSRRAMLDWGYTPSGRLFEATSCGTPVVTDPFPGLEAFFTPGEEILVADTTEDALAVLDLSDAELARIAAAGRQRTLAEHTGDCRARQLVSVCEAVAC